MERADHRALAASASSLEPVDQSMDEAHAVNGPALAQLRSELDSLKAGLTFSLLESPSLKMHFHTTELYLCLVGISTNPGLNTLPDGLSALPAGERWPPWRVELLSAGIVAAKSLLDFYLLQSPQSEMNHNNTEWIQISFALTLAVRLAVLMNQPPVRQETGHLRSFLDMSGLLKDFVNRMQLMVTDEVDDAGDRSVVYHVERRIRRLQTWYEAQVCQVSREPHTASASEGLGPQNAADLSSAAPEMTMPLLQPDFTTDWMYETWFDDLMSIPELCNPVLDASGLGWSGTTDEYRS